jgi:hypothetical protein
MCASLFLPACLQFYMVVIEGFWTLGTIIQASITFALLNTYSWRVLLIVSSIPESESCWSGLGMCFV